MFRSVTIVVTRHRGRARGLFGIVKASALVVPSPFEAPTLPRIQGPQIPQRHLFKTSKCLRRTRFREISGAREISTTIDKPLRSKGKRALGSFVCGRF